MSSNPPSENSVEAIPVLHLAGQDMVNIRDANKVFKQVTGHSYSYERTREVIGNHPEIPREHVGRALYVPVAAVRDLAATLFPPTDTERKPKRGRRKKALAADSAAIKARYEAGESPAQIGKETGITRGTVHYFAKDVVDSVKTARRGRAEYERKQLARQVLTFRQQGWTLERIADKLDRSVPFVRQLLPTELRGTNREVSEEEKAEAIRRVEGGEPISKVSLELDIPGQTLYSWTRPFFLAKHTERPAHAPESIKEEARDLRAQGFLLRDIAEIVGYDLSTVSVWVEDVIPRYTPEQQEEAVAGIKAGRDMQTLVDEMHIEASTIAYWVKQASQSADHA